MPKAVRQKAIVNEDIVAEDLFTDREEPRKAFWDLYNGMEQGDFEIIDFYGVGGAGKTTLLKKIREEINGRIPSGKIDCAYFSFEGHATEEEFLLNLSRQMMLCNKGLSFPLFDTAFVKIATDEGKDISLIESKAKESFLNNPLLDTAVNVGSIFFSNLGVINSAAKAVEYLVDLRNTKKHEKELLASEYAQDYKRILFQSSTENKKNLHSYFLKDIYDVFLNRKTPYVIFLDGYENFVSLLSDGERSRLTDNWLSNPESGLVNIPNVLWVIGGRERLEWDDSILPQDHLHRIGDLSERDTVAFFEKAGVDEELRVPLYRLTGGTPVFMDICVNSYKMICGIRKPQLSDFGNDTEDLAYRYLRDMDKENQMLMIMFSWFPNVWDDELLDFVVKTLHYDLFRIRIEELLRLSLFERISNGYKLHGTFRNIIRRFSEKTTGGKIRNAILLYFKEWLLEVDSSIYRMEKIKQFVSYFESSNDIAIVSAEELIAIVNIIVQECYQLGDYYAWDDLLSRICKHAKEIELPDEVIIYCENKYNYNLYSIGQYETMFIKTQETYDYSISSLGDKHLYSLEALDNLANATDNLGKYEKAIELQSKCYDYRKLLLGEEHPDTLRSLNNLADTYLSSKQFMIAKKLHENCYLSRKKVLGDEHIGTLRSMNNLACSMEKLEEYDKAVILRQECLAIRSRVLGEEHPDTMVSLDAMASVLFRNGECERAIEMLHKCYDIRKQNLGDGHPVTLRTAGKLEAMKLKQYK